MKTLLLAVTLFASVGALAKTVLVGGSVSRADLTSRGPHLTIVIHASEGSISKFDRIFAAGESRLEVIKAEKTTVYACSSLTFQLDDSFTSCEIKGQKQTVNVEPATGRITFY